MPLIILLTIAVLLIGFGYHFARLIVFPKVIPYMETYRRTVEAGHIVEEEYKTWSGEEIRICSPYGYDLFGMYYPVQGSKKVAVFSHGITWSLYGMVKYARLFYKRGWNILIYDLRNHGRSGGKNTTFGYYEKYDLKAVVDWAFLKMGPGGMVGTFGESLGAAVTLQHAVMDPRLCFAIADCPFSDVDELLSYRLMKDYHLPRWPLIPLANFFTRLMTGMTFEKASPIHHIAEIETPVLLAHGTHDDYIPAKMSLDLYQRKQKGVRKIYLAPNAGHAQAFWQNQVEYELELEKFLTEIKV